MTDEARVGVAHRLYECRKTAKAIWGEEYSTRLKPYRKLVRAVADRDHGGNELPAVTAIVKKAEAEGEDDQTIGGLTLWLSAAAVEEIEAREPKTVEERATRLMDGIFGPEMAAKIRRARR